MENRDTETTIDPATTGDPQVSVATLVSEQTAPRSPGFRRLVQDAASVSVPPLGSILRSLAAVGGLLLMLGLLVGEVDARLARVLLRRVPAPAPLGWVAGVLLTAAAVLALRIPLSLSGTARPLSRAERRRWVVAVSLLVAGFLVGVFAAVGAAR